MNWSCFAGSQANPRYGLCWWLSPLSQVPDLVYASGAGGQAMYVIPSAGAVVVKFGNSASWKHDAFLKRFSENEINCRMVGESSTTRNFKPFFTTLW